MAELNHLIVWSKDKHASAKFLGDMLGVPVGAEWGPFVPVKTSNGVTIDFVDGEKDVRMQHYAFLVDDAEFDTAFARIEKAGLTYWADPHKRHREPSTAIGAAGASISKTPAAICSS